MKNTLYSGSFDLRTYAGSRYHRVSYIQFFPFFLCFFFVDTVIRCYRYFHVFFCLPACCSHLLSPVILSPVLPIEPCPLRIGSFRCFLFVISSLRLRDADEVSTLVPVFDTSPVGRSRGGEGGGLLRYTQRNQVLLTAVIRSQTNRGNSKAALSLHSREKLARPFLTSIFRFQERGRFINAVEIKCETQTGCFDCTSSSVVILALCILLCSSLRLPCFYYFIMRYTSVCCDFHFGLTSEP